MNTYTVTAEMDFGVLGFREVEIEYESAGGEVIVLEVWLQIDFLVEIFMSLTDVASDFCHDIALRDWNDRRQDAAEYMEER